MKIAITTGDKFGIGKETIKKALDIIKPDKKDILIIGEKIDNDYEHLIIDEKNNGEFCFKTLEKACELALNNKIASIVTAPVSKSELHKAGHIFNGQTEVIEHFLAPKSNSAQMIFIANDLRVMLLTRHCALKDVHLSIDETIKQAHILNDFLKDKCKIKNPKIALCALNPHAGEEGILGKEEIEILTPAVKELKKQGVLISQPQSADALFGKIGKEYISKLPLSYDAILACYHDQGLCPLKALAFNNAVNTTIGLKVIRTSPCFGTAYDIAGKGIADPTSMVEAIKLALKLR